MPLVDSATGEVVAADIESLAAAKREADERNGVLQNVITRQARDIARLRGESTKAAEAEPSAGEVREVLHYWRDAYHPKAKVPLDGKRAKKVQARLKEGFTVDQLKAALDMAAADPWFVQRQLDDPTTVFRDEATKFLKAAVEDKPAVAVVRPIRQESDKFIPLHRITPLDRVVIALRDEFGTDRVRGEWDEAKQRMVGWISACPIRPNDALFPMRVVGNELRAFPMLACNHGCTHDELAGAVREIELRHDRRKAEATSRARAAA